MSVTQLAITSPALFGRVRAIFLGYNDAVLSGKKEELAAELDVDSGDIDAILCDQYALERCSFCGHWFDKAHCKIDDGHNGFECVQCAAEL